MSVKPSEAILKKHYEKDLISAEKIPMKEKYFDMHYQVISYNRQLNDADITARLAGDLAERSNGGKKVDFLEYIKMKSNNNGVIEASFCKGFFDAIDEIDAEDKGFIVLDSFKDPSKFAEPDDMKIAIILTYKKDKNGKPESATFYHLSSKLGRNGAICLDLEAEGSEGKEQLGFATRNPAEPRNLGIIELPVKDGKIPALREEEACEKMNIIEYSVDLQAGFALKTEIELADTHASY